MHKLEPPLNFNTYIKSILHLTRHVKYSCADKLGEEAETAAIKEIMTAPKPGLVDPLGQGCHSDMDWQTFVRSSEAIAPYWKQQALIGLNGIPPEKALAELRVSGIEMERAMYLVTGNINTHKGLIYLMSLLLYGTGLCIYKEMQITPENIFSFASNAVTGTIERELFPLKNQNPIQKLTHGEKLFLNHGITGIRGEAERGFPTILFSGLPELKRVISMGANSNDALLSSLLAIMESSEDSNVIHRGGYDYWNSEYREMIQKTKLEFDPLSGDHSPLEKLEKAFLQLRISPGGAADLLSCTIFIFNVTKPTCQQ